MGGARPIEPAAKLGQTRKLKPASMEALMSGAAELALPGVVKWAPLSVSAAWVL